MSERLNSAHCYNLSGSAESGLNAGGNVNTEVYVDDGDGDVIAFSGPVPYSFGYGAPIV